jgi:hypothetical protein
MQLLERIQKELQTQNKSVLKLSNETGISAYKIYKWFDNKGSPKHEDSKKLEDWLRSLEKDPEGGTSPQNSFVAENAAHYRHIPDTDAGLHPPAMNGQKAKDYRLLYEQMLERMISNPGSIPKEVLDRINEIDKMLSGFLSEQKKDMDKLKHLVGVQSQNLALIREQLDNIQVQKQLVGRGKDNQR